MRYFDKADLIGCDSITGRCTKVGGSRGKCIENGVVCKYLVIEGGFE